MTNEKIFEQACEAIKPKVEDPNRWWDYTSVSPTTQPNWTIGYDDFAKFVENAEFCNLGDDRYITFLVKDIWISYGCGGMPVNCFFDFVQTNDGLKLFRICPISDDEEE